MFNVHTILYENEQQFLWHTMRYQIYATMHFIAPGLWPQNSPDLFQLTIKSGRHGGECLLHAHTRCCWSKMAPGCCVVWLQQHVIDEASDQLHGRPCACVRIDVDNLTISAFCWIALIDNMNSLLCITLNVTSCDNWTFIRRLDICHCTDNTVSDNNVYHKIVASFY